MLARVGISSCLIGERVRWDGGDRRVDFLDELARAFALVPVCPEVELGMGTPREPIQLVADGGSIRLVGRASAKDHTEAMRRFAERRVAELAALPIAGYVWKARSPSCGLAAPVVGGAPAPGRFAAVLQERLPGLPIAEDEALRDPAERAKFIARVSEFGR